MRISYFRRRWKSLFPLTDGAISRKNGLSGVVANPPSLSPTKIAVSLSLSANEISRENALIRFDSAPPGLFRAAIPVAFSLNAAEIYRANGISGCVTTPPRLFATKIAVAISLNAEEVFRGIGLSGFVRCLRVYFRRRSRPQSPAKMGYADSLRIRLFCSRLILQARLL